MDNKRIKMLGGTAKQLRNLRCECGNKPNVSYSLNADLFVVSCSSCNKKVTGSPDLQATLMMCGSIMSVVGQVTVANIDCLLNSL